MPSRSIIRTGVGPHREPRNRFPAMAAAINLLARRAARVQSRRNLSRSLSPKLDHSHSITRFDRSRTGPYDRLPLSSDMPEVWLEPAARVGAPATPRSDFASGQGDRWSAGSGADCSRQAWPYISDACLDPGADARARRPVRTITVEAHGGANTSVLVRLPQPTLAAR